MANLLSFCAPGLYEIFCIQTQRSYFGHSENIMYRLGRHYLNLEKQVHETTLLQQDWVKYGPQSFVFRPLYYGPDWNCLQVRLEKEIQLIETCSHKVYNNQSPIRSTYRKEWTLNDITYSSGAEAARRLGVSPSHVYRLMKRQGQTRIVSNQKKISIDGQEFESLTQAQSLLGVTRSTLSRRLRSEKWSTWVYLQKTRSNDYPQRE